MILNGLYLFDEQAIAGDSQIIYNTKGTILVLQVKCDSTFEVVVKGCLQMDKNDYADLAAINMAYFEEASAIEEEGIYQVDISGCQKVKLTLNSIGDEPITIYGAVKEG